jgi:hypothetical protein
MPGPEFEAMIEGEERDQPPSPYGPVIICVLLALSCIGAGGAAWNSDFERNFGIGGVLIGSGVLAAILGYRMARGK